MSNPIKPAERERILRLLKDGKSIREVAWFTGRAESTIDFLVKNFARTGEL